MPELPEVETIRRDLSSALLHRTIQSLQVNDPAVLTGIGPKGLPRWKVSVRQFERGVMSSRIGRFDRRGKYLVMEFADRTALIFHLRMTGQLLLTSPKIPWRMRLRFDGESELYFADRRRF